MFARMSLGRWRSTVALGAIWLFATLIDLDKPFHVDDSFHLEMAEWIMEHPGQPMSGMITWDDGRVPMSIANQPPGFYYAIALTGKLFGYCETPMHLMRSLFTLLAIVCFHRLARRYHAAHALLLTALLALGPAFLVNQGLMVDMPLLAVHLLFFDLLLRERTPRRWMQLALAGLVMGAAMLVKYTTAPLLALFPLALWMRGEKRMLGWSVLPLVVLLLWSWTNVCEFGYPHLLSRGEESVVFMKAVRRAGSWICCLGALAPFTLLFVGALVPAWRKHSTWLLSAFAAGAGVLGLLVWTGMVPECASDNILRVAFIANGVLLTIFFARMAAVGKAIPNADRWILIGWMLGVTLLVIVFAPTMGSRHLLLVLPPLFLISAPALDGLPASPRWMAVCLTAMLGIALAVADKAHARFYQHGAQMASAELAAYHPKWSVGLWGWQWYSRRSGMLIYPDDPLARHQLGVNDIVVKAEGVHQQNLDPNIKLRAFRTWAEPRPWWTFLYAADMGSLYTSDWPRLPWRFDRDAHNSITAYRVMGGI